MSTPEGLVKAAIIRELHRLIPDVWWYPAQDRFTAGILDIIICYKTRFIALEIKAPGQKARKLQEYMIRKIRRAGGIAECVDNVEDAMRIIHEVANER